MKEDFDRIRKLSTLLYSGHIVVQREIVGVLQGLFSPPDSLSFMVLKNIVQL